MIDLADPRSAIIADVLANKTCKKMLVVLAEKPLSVSALSETLHIPLTTADYTVKKLISAGFIEQADFFWSAKGKKVPSYRVSDTHIVIAPRRIMKGVVPALLVSFVGAFSVYELTKPLVIEYPEASASAGALLASQTVAKASDIVQPLVNLQSHAGLWFITGALLALLVVLLCNWRKIW